MNTRPISAELISFGVLFAGRVIQAVGAAVSKGWSDSLDWRKVSYTYKTGSAETSFSLVFLSENQQILWLDDLCMIKLGGSEDLVQNAGFEETPNGDADPAKD
ncbi:hypothetical protein M5X11_11955 [Paenibacillus alginolyticus]|uniref:hypothetical protein n=1 Tax=Paenibacillus alginolyticus TaxID=59839 RepID=UPI00042837A1|nr:hypothetical protein [Paenibacillus alginolyticus]MCY9665668.1 hypothetical protein [Paenibacillus alginolyticus]